MSECLIDNARSRMFRRFIDQMKLSAFGRRLDFFSPTKIMRRRVETMAEDDLKLELLRINASKKRRWHKVPRVVARYIVIDEIKRREAGGEAKKTVTFRRWVPAAGGGARPVDISVSAP